MKPLVRRLTTTAAAVAIAGTAFLASGATASASPSDNGSACGYGSSDGNIYSCIYVSPSSISYNATVGSSGRVIELCLHLNGVLVGPCSGYTYVPAGQSLGAADAPQGSGQYCVETWKQQNDGSTVHVGEECVG